MAVGGERGRPQRLGPMLEALADADNIAICLFDAGLVITALNGAMAALHDIAADEHEGRRMRDVNPGPAAIVEPLLRRVLETDEPVTDVTLTTSAPGRGQGHYRALASFYPLHDGDRLTGVASICWDVTDRTDPDLLLGDAERRFRSMADAAPVLIWLTADDGRCVWVNQRWAEWTGRARQDEGGYGWLDGVHPDDRDRVEASMLEAHRVASASHPHEAVYRLRRADGSYGWLLQRAVPRATHTGMPSGMVGTCTDITEIQELQRRVVDTRDRLERLHQLATALARATTTVDVAFATLDHGITAVGARAAIAVELDDDADMLEVVAARGYDDRVVGALRRFSVDADLPLAAAVRSGRRVQFSSSAEMLTALPGMLEHVDVAEDVAVIALPLVTNAGVLGAFAVSFGEPRALAAEELALMDTVAAQSAQAFERAQLYEREAQARARAEAASERVHFLVRASDVLSSSLDLRQTLRSLARVSVPQLADSCLVYLLDRQGAPSIVVAEHRDPGRSRELLDLAQRRPVALDTPDGVGFTLRTGRSELLADLEAVSDPHLRGLGDIGAGAAAVLPIEDVSGALGAMVFLAEPQRHTAPEDFELAQELTRRAGTAVVNAMAYGERNRIARGLQKSLLPVRLPEIPGVDLGARYVPAGQGLEVGGDFYDAFTAQGGRWVLAIGDVRGRGVAAAAVTGTARVALRSAAWHDASPRHLLEHLNAILLQQEGELEEPLLPVPRFCTVCIAVLEPGDRGVRATLCCAGHPLPLLVRPSGEVAPVGEPGMLLGVVEAPELWERTLDLDEGDAIVFATDGILERRHGERLFEDELPEVLAASAAAPADEIAGRVEAAAHAFGQTPSEDDMAVLVARAARAG